MDDVEAFLGKRRDYSEIRLVELRRAVTELPSIARLPSLSIFCAGSYGRLEAGEHSDIDLFFIYADDPSEIPHRRTEEFRLFGGLISIADRMAFPAFSNDSQYLTTMACPDLLEHLGSPVDDEQNHFTLRMLMMLESRPISGDAQYEQILERVVDSYYRDYPDHQASFKPWFMVNDICRFWKTLLLNYERKRNPADLPEAEKQKQKVRNFKLKFSRMTTCFATLAALAAREHPIDAEQLIWLFKLTPQERLLDVAVQRPETKDRIAELRAEYAWFMEMTALTEVELMARFSDKQERFNLFQRANEYGTKMFGLLSLLDGANGGPTESFIRYLVI